MIENYTFIIKKDDDGDFVARTYEVPGISVFAPSLEAALLELVELLEETLDEGPEPLDFEEAMEEIGLF